MKKLIVSLFAPIFATVTGQGGPVEPAYQQAQTYQPSQDWFRDREWNFDLFGAYDWPARSYEADKYLGTIAVSTLSGNGATSRQSARSGPGLNFASRPKSA